MRKETINGHRFEFFDEIAELPVERFHQYSRYMLVASGIGDSFDDIDKHLGKILALIKIDPDKARQEVLNLRQNIYMVLNERDIRHKGLFYLTKSVDGKEWTDFSDNGIDELFSIASKASIAEINRALGGVVARIDDELHQYFPDLFDDSVEKNTCDALRKRALLQVDEMQNGSDHTKEIEQLNVQIYRAYKPKNFENDAAVIEFDRQFENMCLILSKEFKGGVKGYTIIEFYSAYNLLKEQQKEMRKFNKKNK